MSETPDAGVLPAGLRFIPIATSLDMMAPASAFCPAPIDFLGRPTVDYHFPYLWRSSLAISVAEDPFVDPCTDAAAIRISYVKVTATIAGYQPHRPRDTAQLPAFLTGDSPDPQQLLAADRVEYLPCYGALLRVQVFPPAGDTPLARYPHIVDFEPKLRDLYQPATETSQMLSGSSSAARVDRTTKSIQSTEWGLSGTVSASYGPGQDKAGGSISASVTGSYKNTFGAETTGQITGERDASAQSASGIAVNISQIYSILTGYHAGTNTASILIQPRPHIEQAEFTIGDFVPGLRAIEGIQEAVFVVVRPKDMTGLRVQATIETAHLSAATVAPRPRVDLNPSRLDRPDVHTISSDPDPFGPTAPILPKYTAYWHMYADPPGGDYGQRVWLFTLNPAVDAEGFELEIDTSAGDGGAHPGVSKILDMSPRHDQSRILLEEYGAISPNMFRVAITQRPDVVSTDGPPNWLKVYAPWVRRRYPEPVLFRAQAAALVTVRETCGGYGVDAHGCIIPIDPAALGHGTLGSGDHLIALTPGDPQANIVDEHTIVMDIPSLTGSGAHRAGSVINRQMRAILSSGPRAYPAGLVNFDTSDLGAAKIAAALDKQALGAPLSAIPGVNTPKELAAITVSELLMNPMKDLSAKYGVALAAIAVLRSDVLAAVAGGKPAGK